MARQPRQPTLSLSELASRIGTTKLAKRFGVTERTVKGWLKKGPSSRAVEQVRKVLVRAEGGYKAAETRRQVERFREGLQPPKESELTPEQVLPKRPPMVAPEVKKLRKVHHVKSEKEPYETEIYTGFRQWVEVNQPVGEVEVQAIVDTALYALENRSESWLYINFLFYRYIPVNPAYVDSFLLSNQGKWVEFFTKTPARSNSRNIEQAIINVFEGYEKVTQDGKLKHVYGANELAERRVIFLGSYQIVVLKRK